MFSDVFSYFLLFVRQQQNTHTKKRMVSNPSEISTHTLYLFFLLVYLLLFSFSCFIDLRKKNKNHENNYSWQKAKWEKKHKAIFLFI